MYSINVFLTFSLSMLAMLRLFVRERRSRPRAGRRIALFAAGLGLCVVILAVTVFEKFAEGGWVTVVITLSVVAACLVVRRHYRAAAATVDALYRELGDLPGEAKPARAPDPAAPVAAVLVENFGGVGIHTLLNVFRSFPNHFKGVVFLSVGVVDSGDFKGEHAVEEVTARTEAMLARYVSLAAAQGVPATSRLAVGTEVVAEAERLCLEVASEYPRVTFFTGRLLFKQERWWHALLHNGTALAIQRRLHWAGRTMVTLPIRVTR